MGTRRLYVNESANDPADALVESFRSRARAQRLVFTQGDTAAPIEIHFIEENTDPSQNDQPFIYGTAPSSTKLGIGPLDEQATAGTYTITDVAGSQTTAAIAIGASAATVQTALRAACTTNFSAATVTGTGDIGEGFIIDRVTVGAIVDITISTAATSPENCAAEIVNTDNGTADLSEKWAVKVVQRPAIYQSSFSAVTYSTPAAASVTTGTATANAVHRLTWPSAAYAGSITISQGLPTGSPISITSNTMANPTVFTTATHSLTTGDKIAITTNNGSDVSVVGVHTVTVLSATTFSIPVNCGTAGGTGGTFYKVLTADIGPIGYNPTTTEIEDLFEEHTSTLAIDGNFTAEKVAQGNFLVTFKGTLAQLYIAAATVTSNLSTPVAVSGTLNCKTGGVLTILSTSQEATTKLEIEKTVSSVPTAVAYRDDVLLRAEILST